MALTYAVNSFTCSVSGVVVSGSATGYFEDSCELQNGSAVGDGGAGYKVFKPNPQKTWVAGIAGHWCNESWTLIKSLTPGTSLAVSIGITGSANAAGTAVVVRRRFDNDIETEGDFNIEFQGTGAPTLT